MALATINLTLENDFLEKIDSIARGEAKTRDDIIYNSIKVYINQKQKLQELYAYGENVAKGSNFTENDVFEEITKYRNSK